MSRTVHGPDGSTFMDLYIEKTLSVAITWRDGRALVEHGSRSGASVRWTGPDSGIHLRALDGTSKGALEELVGAACLGAGVDASQLFHEALQEADTDRLDSRSSVERVEPGSSVRGEGRLQGRRAPPERSTISDREAGPPLDTHLDSHWKAGHPLDPHGLIDYLEEAASAVEATMRGVASAVEVAGRAHAYEQEVRIMNALGGVSDARGGVRIELNAASRGAQLQRRAADRTIHELRSRVPPHEWGGNLGRSLIERREVHARPQGDLMVIFAGTECGALLHEIGHLFEEPQAGDGNPLHRSNERVGAEGLTVVDDPRASGGRGSYARDDEGAEPSAVTLIEKGRLAGRLHQEGECLDGPAGVGPRRSKSARAGHARRGSYQDAPRARMSCTFLAPGRDDPHAILASTPRGLMIDSLRSGRIDPASGTILLVANEGWMIERGRRTQPVTDCLLVSDARSLITSVDAIGCDLSFDRGVGTCVKWGQPVPVMVGLPTIRTGVIRVVTP